MWSVLDRSHQWAIGFLCNKIILTTDTPINKNEYIIAKDQKSGWVQICGIYFLVSK